MSAVERESAAFTVVIAALGALVMGGMLLSFVVYPIYNGLIAPAPLGGAETSAGSRVFDVTGGLFPFWGAILLIAILSFIWVRTRRGA